MLFAASSALEARTIVLTAEDCDQMAVIAAKAPRMSWVVYQVATKVYATENQLQLFGDMALLLRFPLDQVPKGQRITKAELSFGVDYVAGKANINVRRMLTEWGTGVCYQYRMTYPKKTDWAAPGGKGAGTDRAAKDSAMFKIEKVGDYTVDVTEDVELWYTGGAANRGWMLSIDDGAGVIYAGAPYSPHTAYGKRWKLQITYEPQ